MSKIALDSIAGTVDQLSPPEKLELIEKLAHSLRTQPLGPSAEQKREAMHQLRQKLAALPVVNPADGFAGREHDQALYGESR